jgi:hypothetical protein
VGGRGLPPLLALVRWQSSQGAAPPLKSRRVGRVGRVPDSPRKERKEDNRDTTPEQVPRLSATPHSGALRQKGSLQSLLDYAAANAREFDSFAVSVFFFNLDRLCQEPLSTLQRRVVLDVCDQLRSTFDRLDARALVTMLHRMTKLDLEPSADFRADWSRASAARLSECTAQELANVISAIAKLGWSASFLSRSFFESFARACRARIGEFTKVATEVVIRALHRLEAREPRKLMLDMTSPSLLGLVSPLAAHATVMRGQTDLYALLDYAAANVKQFDSFDVSSFFLSLDTCARSSALSNEHRQVVVSVCDQLQLEQLDVRALVTMLHRLGKLGIEPSATFYSAWSRVATPLLPTFTDQELVNTVSALGRLEWSLSKMGRPFFEAWAKVCQGDVCCLMNRGQLAESVVLARAHAFRQRDNETALRALSRLEVRGVLSWTSSLV